MRKTAIVFLIFLYTCSQLGSVAWQYYKPLVRTIFSTRQRFRSFKNDPEGLVLIKVDKATFGKIKVDRKEVRWKGILHDIEQQTHYKNEVHLLLRKDEGETWWLALQQTINDWIKKTGNKHAVPVWQWLMKIYTAPVNQNNTPLPYHTFPTYLDVLNTFLPPAPFLPGTGQPPDYTR